MADARRSDALRNRERVVATAADMRRHGEPVQLNVVARKAGVGVGTVYRHFATVEQLTEALVLGRFDELERRAAGVTGQDDLHGFLEHALAVFVDDDDFAAVATRPRPALSSTAEARHRLLAALTAAFDRVLAGGRPAQALTPVDALVLLCGVAHAIRVSGADADHSRRYLDTVLRGIFASR